ncbi:MAG: hypothetical protein Q7S76_02575 [bacterium]|nr:hypothetical protein [bacterium]
MVGFSDTQGYDESTPSADDLLVRVESELEELYAAQEHAQNAQELERARSSAALLQSIQRTLSHVKNLRPGMALSSAIDDLIRTSASHSDPQSAAKVEAFQVAKEYMAKPPLARTAPLKTDVRPVNETATVEQTIEHLKQRIQLEGLLFINSSLPREQWEEGRKNSAILPTHQTLSGFDSAYCPGQSPVRDPNFLTISQMSLFSPQGWGASEAKEFPEYRSVESRDTLTFRIAPIEEAVYERKKTHVTTPKKPLFGFIPQGMEERIVTEKVYAGTKGRPMQDFTKTHSQKPAYHVSFRRTAWCAWERPGTLGRPGDESITLIVSEDIARDVAALYSSERSVGNHPL